MIAYVIVTGLLFLLNGILLLKDMPLEAPLTGREILTSLGAVAVDLAVVLWATYILGGLF